MTTYLILAQSSLFAAKPICFAALTFEEAKKFANVHIENLKPLLDPNIQRSEAAEALNKISSDIDLLVEMQRDESFSDRADRIRTFLDYFTKNSEEVDMVYRAGELHDRLRNAIVDKFAVAQANMIAANKLLNKGHKRIKSPPPYNHAVSLPAARNATPARRLLPLELHRTGFVLLERAPEATPSDKSLKTIMQERQVAAVEDMRLVDKIFLNDAKKNKNNDKGSNKQPIGKAQPEPPKITDSKVLTEESWLEMFDKSISDLRNPDLEPDTYQNLSSVLTLINLARLQNLQLPSESYQSLLHTLNEQIFALDRQNIQRHELEALITVTNATLNYENIGNAGYHLEHHVQTFKDELQNKIDRISVTEATNHISNDRTNRVKSDGSVKATAKYKYLWRRNVEWAVQILELSENDTIRSRALGEILSLLISGKSRRKKIPLLVYQHLVSRLDRRLERAKYRDLDKQELEDLIEVSEAALVYPHLNFSLDSVFISGLHNSLKEAVSEHKLQLQP